MTVEDGHEAGRKENETCNVNVTYVTIWSHWVTDGLSRSDYTLSRFRVVDRHPLLNNDDERTAT